MSGIKGGTRAVSDLIEGRVVASVEIAAPPERVFQALSSREIVDWWVNPGVFDTREWAGAVQVGGKWRASGIARGKPYTLEGEFVEVNPPRKLVHTWHMVGAPGTPSTVSYLLEPVAGGTRLTVHQSGIPTSEERENNRNGWQTSFDRLAEILSSLGG
ncbi:MAG TPA: SRPBCC domain-containing protein [Roseiarcus sp.]|nr:SRPBCC domain-containing protein [Roseiarcus sp.]